LRRARMRGLESLSISRSRFAYLPNLPWSWAKHDVRMHGFPAR
jgi:hypothetical protein